MTIIKTKKIKKTKKQSHKKVKTSKRKTILRGGSGNSKVKYSTPSFKQQQYDEGRKHEKGRLPMPLPEKPKSTNTSQIRPSSVYMLPLTPNPGKKTVRPISSAKFTLQSMKNIAKFEAGVAAAQNLVSTNRARAAAVINKEQGYIQLGNNPGVTSIKREPVYISANQKNVNPNVYATLTSSGTPSSTTSTSSTSSLPTPTTPTTPTTPSTPPPSYKKIQLLQSPTDIEKSNYIKLLETMKSIENANREHKKNMKALKFKGSTGNITRAGEMLMASLGQGALSKIVGAADTAGNAATTISQAIKGRFSNLKQRRANAAEIPVEIYRDPSVGNIVTGREDKLKRQALQIIANNKSYNRTGINTGVAQYKDKLEQEYQAASNALEAKEREKEEKQREKQEKQKLKRARGKVSPVSTEAFRQLSESTA